MPTPLRIAFTPDNRANSPPLDSWHFVVPATDQRGFIDGRLDGVVQVALRRTRRHALLVRIPWAGRFGLLPLRVLVTHPSDAVQFAAVDFEAARRRQNRVAQWRAGPDRWMAWWRCLGVRMPGAWPAVP